MTIENKAKDKKQKSFCSKLIKRNGKILLKLRIKSDKRQYNILADYKTSS